ncbi:MAG: CPBP family intramembrane metalloprotease [Gammaproteobacteria bacterium]|nr:CPBP family intramembrane metalloprotease [Gammaproteobacteria bacterium]MDE0192704.1 CPBP family intramembrane metalloprotease [Gammaproteobacteria bacterium]
MSNNEAPVREPAAGPEAGADWAPWGLWATAGLGLAVLLAFVVLQAIPAVPFMAENPEAIEDLQTDAGYVATATLVSSLGCTLIILALVAIRKGATPSGYLALRWPGWRPLLTWVFVAALVVAALDVITHLLGREVVAEWWMALYATVKEPLFIGFATVVAAPLFEEAFFRGFLFSGLSRSKLGAAGTIIVTAALWTVIHLQYGAYEVGQIFVLGLLLGVARHRTNSLVVPFTIHAAINLAANIQVAYLIQG